MANWRGGSSRHTFLKLHGGINWWDIGGQITYLRWTGGQDGELERKWNEYDSGSTDDRPVILEPSFYKYEDRMYKQLGDQWDRFFTELLDSDFVLIVGYSVPEMDVNARSRILTAFQANRSAMWMVVDPSDQICGTYQRLLGSERLSVVNMSLAGFNNDIETHVQNALPAIDSK